MSLLRSLKTLGICLGLMACHFGCSHNSAMMLWSVDNNDLDALPRRTPGAGKQFTQTETAEEKDESIDLQQRKNNLLFAKAQLAEADQDAEQAIKLYEAIVQTDSDHAPASHRLAILLAQEGKLKSAEDYFQLALRAESDDPQLHCNYGYFCYLLRRWDDAEFHLTQAIELDPALRHAHNNLGLLHARLGNYEKAKRHFEIAGCTPTDSLNNIGFARLLEKDYGGAKAAYRRALNEDPAHSKAREGLAAANRLADGDSSTGDSSQSGAIRRLDSRRRPSLPAENDRADSSEE